MQDLVRRDWFHRMWTIQELVMATEPIVVCGNKSIHWGYLATYLIHSRDRPEFRNNEDSANAFSSVATITWFYITISTMAMWKETSGTIFQFLI
jgi:hypothetical protein